MIVDSGRSPTEQLSNHNEFGSGVFLVCLTQSGRVPAGEFSGERKELSGCNEGLHAGLPPYVGGNIAT